MPVLARKDELEMDHGFIPDPNRIVLLYSSESISLNSREIEEQLMTRKYAKVIRALNPVLNQSKLGGVEKGLISFYLGIALSRTGEALAAKEAFNVAIPILQTTKNPRAHEAIYNRGLAYFKLGFVRNADEDLYQAATLGGCPDEIRGQAWIALAALALEFWDDDSPAKITDATTHAFECKLRQEDRCFGHFIALNSKLKSQELDSIAPHLDALKAEGQCGANYLTEFCTLVAAELLQSKSVAITAELLQDTVHDSDQKSAGDMSSLADIFQQVGVEELALLDHRELQLLKDKVTEAFLMQSRKLVGLKPEAALTPRVVNKFLKASAGKEFSDDEKMQISRLVSSLRENKSLVYCDGKQKQEVSLASVLRSDGKMRVFEICQIGKERKRLWRKKILPSGLEFE